MIPHHGGHAVARPHSKFGHRIRKSPRSAVKVAKGGSNHGAVGPAGDYFDSVEQLARPLQNCGKRQRKIHHRPAHGFGPFTSQLGGILPSFANQESRKPSGSSPYAPEIASPARTIVEEPSRLAGLFPIAKAVNFREYASDR